MMTEKSLISHFKMLTKGKQSTRHLQKKKIDYITASNAKRLMLSTHSLTANIQAFKTHINTAASDFLYIYKKKQSLMYKNKPPKLNNSVVCRTSVHADLILGEVEMLSLHHV